MNAEPGDIVWYGIWLKKRLCEDEEVLVSYTSSPQFLVSPAADPVSRAPVRAIVWDVYICSSAEEKRAALLKIIALTCFMPNLECIWSLRKQLAIEGRTASTIRAPGNQQNLPLEGANHVPSVR